MGSALGDITATRPTLALGAPAGADAVTAARRELKFAFRHADVGKLSTLLAVNARRVVFGAEAVSCVCSIYFDDERLTALHESVAGVARRSKLRVRWYDRPMADGPLFFDRTAESGIGQSDVPMTGFGCALFDVDHDGDTDAFVANGGVRRALGFEDAIGGDFWDPYSEINLAMGNEGGGTFRDMTSETGSFGAEREVSRALAVGDLDEDGDLDLVLSNIDNSLRVYRNDAPRPGSHWLMVRAMSGPRDAIGAEIVVTAGGRTFMGIVLRSTGYLSSNDPRVHFGLGAIDRVDRVDVRWPDGRRERFDIDGVDRHVTLHAGGGLAE